MKICLAGTGAMGEIHVKALSKIDGAEIVSVSGRTDDGAKAFATKWNIPFCSSSLEDCIDRPGVDAVILTTPSALHADQTILALSKGKHVQVEIPMSLNLPDAQRMLEAAKKARKVCMVTHTRRFSSPHREIRRRIQEGSFHLYHMVVETYFFRRTDLTVAMKSKKGPLFSMAMSFNNKGPFGGFYRYIGEEETYKVYRDSMTDSEGKEVQLDGVPAFDRQDVEFVSAIREGREPESSAATCVPTMALLDKIDKAMARS
jgi:2-hydroxy-4-carboxymuconate semialdehyde hemiacetal dehydrogenase